MSLQVLNWPTPDASGFNASESRESWEARAKRQGRKGNGAEMPLAIVVQPSPSLPQAPAIPAGPISSENTPGSLLPSQRMKLSPYFAENLMGAPMNLTSKTARIGSEQLATWYAQCRRALDLLYLQIGLITNGAKKTN